MDRNYAQNRTPGPSHGGYTASSNTNQTGPGDPQSGHTSTGQAPAAAPGSSVEPMDIDDEDVIMGDAEEAARVEPADLLLLLPGPIRRPKDKARESYITQYRAPPVDAAGLVERLSRPYYTSTPPDLNEHRCRDCLHLAEEDLYPCRECKRTYWKKRWYEYDLGKFINGGKFMKCRWD
ncbi:hypothetical protein TWF696_006628 [Orbilia brochopaga]|uniref:Uncharacterized protein n=1 Tax=Orbilia brochopaga TaxID=3140254 RepID=A0AAV9UTS3_9PEZI